MSLKKLILRELESGPLTCRELSARLGSKMKTCHAALTRAHAEKLVYVQKWVRSGQNWAPVFANGDQPSEPKPRRLSNAEVCRRYKRRHGIGLAYCPCPLTAIRLGLRLATGFADHELAESLGWHGRGQRWEYKGTLAQPPSVIYDAASA